MQSGEYYLKVESYDKGKGKYNSGYSLGIAADYAPCDNSDDSYLSNSLTKIAAVTDNSNSIENNYVGYGDAVDNFRFSVEADFNKNFDLKISDIGAGDKVNFALYELHEKSNGQKYRTKLASSTAYNNGNALQNNVISDIWLDEGDYIVEVLSYDKGKGKYNTSYDLALVYGKGYEDIGYNSLDEAVAGKASTGEENFIIKTSNVVYGRDKSDFYKFELTAPKNNIDIALSELEGNERLKINGYKQNGNKIEKLFSDYTISGDSAYNYNTFNGLKDYLGAGDYIVEVTTFDGKACDYKLDVSIALI